MDMSLKKLWGGAAVSIGKRKIPMSEMGEEEMTTESSEEGFFLYWFSSVTL